MDVLDGAGNTHTYTLSDLAALGAPTSITMTGGASETAPTITSNGGGNTAGVSVAENTTAVTTVTATDPDAGQTLSYSISGGADAGKFTIGSATGALSFITAPNFEVPTDAGGNNVYDVIVQASDGHGGTDTQAIAVTVTDIIEVVSVAPVAHNDIYLATQNAPLSVTTTAGVLSNDTDPNGLPLSSTLLDNPTHGTLVFNQDGSFLYTPQPGFTGTDAFSYTAGDASGVHASNNSDVGIATIIVGEPALSVVDIQNDHLAIMRTSLSLDQASALLNSINSGTLTEFQYINSLLAQGTNATIPAIAVEATMYGAVGTAAEVDLLVNQFLPSQEANAIKLGLNALVYDSEALGLTFAFGNETGSTAFIAKFGPTNAILPNTAAGDAAFTSAAVNAIFGPAATSNLVTAMNGWVANWKAFYTTNGIPSITTPNADQVDLAARAAAWGDAVGVALDDNLGLKGQAINFLMDAAEGIADYSMSLIGQPAHHPFQGEI